MQTWSLENGLYGTGRTRTLHAIIERIELKRLTKDLTIDTSRLRPPRTYPKLLTCQRKPNDDSTRQYEKAVDLPERATLPLKFAQSKGNTKLRKGDMPITAGNVKWKILLSVSGSSALHHRAWPYLELEPLPFFFGPDGCYYV